jgi:hypothetical protein
VSTEVDSPTGAPVQRTRPAELLPFAWSRTAAAEPVPNDRDSLFRFPAADDPDPGTVRVLAMSLYSAFLGLGGVGVGLRGLVAVMGGAPGWFIPVLALVGLAGVVLAVGALLSVHRRFLPWALLLAAAVPLTGDMLIAMAY